MDRRDAIRLIGSAAAIPALAGFDADRLWAIGASTHLRAAGGAGAGAVLNAHQLETAATIAEHVLPRTDTPGARDAGVPEFVDLLLAEWYDDGERAAFLEGLAAIDASARAAGAASFTALAAPARITLLQALDAAATRPPVPGPGTPATPGSAEQTYARLKGLTLYGYFTSKPVMTSVLKTNIWPGRYDGCVPA